MAQDTFSLFKDRRALWVWPAECRDVVNHYVEFRQEFDLADAPSDGNLAVSVDSNYAVWINGEFVDCGQYHDYPSSKTCDLIDVTRFLRQGPNTMCVLAYHQGEGSFQYLRGTPGLIYVLEAGPVCVTSGLDTLCRKSRSYTAGPMPRITPQLGFTWEYDARGDDGWRAPDYTPGGDWRHITPEDTETPEQRPVARVRPVSKLHIEKRLPTRIVAQGLFRRENDSSRTVAQRMQSDFLSAMTLGDLCGAASDELWSGHGIEIPSSRFSADGGVYLVIDLYREEAGLLELDIECQAGVTIDIAWGEHLDDLRVRSYVGGRDFACRYVCREGRQSFIHPFTRLAGRCLELHISQSSGPFSLRYAGLRPTEYPVSFSRSFRCADDLKNRIYDTAVRTLHLCMHEHYEDCPWREQALYANDSANQALSGYYCFGNYDFAAASFELLGNSLNPADGYLELCAPAKIDITIPSFSMAWVMAVADHYRFSGDRNVMSKLYATAREMMSVHISRMVDGMLPCPQGERYWHFYDWAEGLDGSSNDYAKARLAGETRFDAPLNLFFLLALDSAAVLADACGCQDAGSYRSAAEALRKVFHARFWDEREQAYITYDSGYTRAHHAELTQALALLAGACPSEIAPALRRKLASPRSGLVEATLSQSIYKFDALLQDAEEYAPWVFRRISSDWGYMLTNGATSFWETINGADDFGQAGSLCHGWSGIPVYFYQAYLLGVRPLEPGFETFLVEPARGIASHASGRVPTPHGCIELSWEETGGEIRCSLSHPAQTTAVCADGLALERPA